LPYSLLKRQEKEKEDRKNAASWKFSCGASATVESFRDRLRSGEVKAGDVAILAALLMNRSQ